MTNDDLLAKLFTSGNALDGFSDEDLLPALDLAGVLLTGGRPRADILPQKGQQASPLTTLLTDDGDPTRGAVVPGLETPLLELLIDPTGPPFRRPPAAPARADRPPVHAAAEKSVAVHPLEWRPFLLAAVLPLWWGLRRATTPKATPSPRKCTQFRRRCCSAAIPCPRRCERRRRRLRRTPPPSVPKSR
jgi:hypothetical protein